MPRLRAVFCRPGSSLRNSGNVVLAVLALASAILTRAGRPVTITLAFMFENAASATVSSAHTLICLCRFAPCCLKIRKFIQCERNVTQFIHE